MNQQVQIIKLQREFSLMSYSPRQLSHDLKQLDDVHASSLSPKKISLSAQRPQIHNIMAKFGKSSTVFKKTQFPPNKTQILTKTKNILSEKGSKKIESINLKTKMSSLKPITLNQYDDNQFIIQPRAKKDVDKRKELVKQKVIENEQTQTPCIGLINPMYINVKCNPKRLATSCQLMKQRHQNFEGKNLLKAKNNIFQPNSTQYQPIQTSSLSPVKRQRQNPSNNLYFKIVSEMNDYFNSMKLSTFKNNKTQMMAKKNAHLQNQKRQLQSKKQLYQGKNKQIQEEENLNIIRLRPRTQDYQRIDRNYSSNVNFPCGKSSKKRQTEVSFTKIYQSQQIMTQKNEQLIDNQQISNQADRYKMIEYEGFNSMIISNVIVESPPHRLKQKKIFRPSTQQIRRTTSTSNKKILYKGFSFGQINLPKNSPDQIYRLKVLYYKDLLWKNMFNIGIRYMPFKDNNNEFVSLKYFVGKGNNSKLIKNIMAKRWWWSLDSKQENSHFVWTQLKLYSIYEKQPSSMQKLENSLSPEKSQNQISLINENANQKTSNQQKKFVDNSALILNPQKRQLWQSYVLNEQNLNRQKKITEENINTMRKRLQLKSGPIKSLQSPLKFTNHLQFSKTIGNKKALYKVMMFYFEKVKKCQTQQIFVPLTYHITAGLEDQQYLKFLTEYYKRNKLSNKTCWIVKPGQLTNRGRGITYCKDLNEIKPIVKQKQTHPNGSLKTFLIQQYLDRPLLYKGRKFDIRHYIMISSINGKIRGYFCQLGYIRTTSYKYNLNDNSPMIHLTNDAVQKYCKDYGKYEKGNKLSYQQFDEYIKEKYSSEDQQKKIDFFNTIHPQIRKISTDVIHAAYYFVDPKRKMNNFEIFGLDIMIDQNFKCYLIQVNTNPCLQLSSPVLRAVIPQMLDNAFALTLDHCYPPPQNQPLSQYNKKYKYPMSHENKFELVFDEDFHGKALNKIYESEIIQPNQLAGIGDDDENFQSCEQDNQDY